MIMLSRILKSLSVLAAICALTLMTSEVYAEILLARTRTTATVYGGASYTVDFNGSASGGQTFAFATSEPNTRVVITFNAECAVKGNAFNWLDVDIIVDPAGSAGETVVPPSNGDNAFCSGNETHSDFVSDAGDGWVSAVTQATMVLAQAGTHTVRVRVDGQHTGGISRLDDFSLIVQE
jgi:hypothetical protein